MLTETQTVVGWFVWFWGKVKGWLPKGSSGGNHSAEGDSTQAETEAQT